MGYEIIAGRDLFQFNISIIGDITYNVLPWLISFHQKVPTKLAKKDVLWN